MVLSSRTCKPWTPFVDEYWHLCIIQFAVLSYMAHSQIALGATPHLCMDEWKHQTPVRRWFNLIHAGLNRANPSGQGPASGMKERSLEALLCHSALQVRSAHSTTLIFCSLMVLMNCFAAGTNGCCNLSCRGCLAGSA